MLRRGPSFLLEAAYKKDTLRKYKKAVRLFLAWLAEDGGFADPAGFVDFDSELADYFHYLFIEHDGRLRYLAADAVNGIVMFFPQLKFQLASAHKALSGWKRLVPVEKYPPITWEMTVAIAMRLFQRGLHAFAMGTLVSFDCYLRISEMCSVTFSGIACPADARVGEVLEDVALSLPKTKRGMNQWVTVRAQVASLLRVFLLSKTFHADESVFGASTETFRSAFKGAAADLGLPPSLVPHSLRHGGATFDFLRGLALADVLFRGRWASPRSATHYIQQGRALLLQSHLPQSMRASVGRVSKDLASFFRFRTSGS
jgi:integrase